MAASIFTTGLTAIRDLLKTGFSPIIVLSDDATAFAATQSVANPSGGSTVTLPQTATIANVDAKTYTATVTVNGSTQLTGKVINTVSAATGTVAAPVTQSRTVRGAGLGIGVQAGDLYTIGLQVAASDVS